MSRDRPAFGQTTLHTYINPQHFIKIVCAIFEKFEILIFFLCELLLILGVGGKLKRRLEIFTREPCISNLNEIGQLVQAVRSATVTQTDRQTDTQTHTHTHTDIFFKRHFQTLGCSMINHKKSKSKILSIVILPSLLMSLESKY